MNFGGKRQTQNNCLYFFFTFFILCLQFFILVHSRRLKFTEKHLGQSILLTELKALDLELYYQKDNLTLLLYCEICEISKITVFYRTSANNCLEKNLYLRYNPIEKKNIFLGFSPKNLDNIGHYLIKNLYIIRIAKKWGYKISSWKTDVRGHDDVTFQVRNSGILIKIKFTR